MGLQIQYQEQIRPKLQEELGVKSIMAVPKVVKIVIDTGIGDIVDNKLAIDELSKDLAALSGQKPQIRPAKRAVAGFNTRAGTAVGLRVTLRGKRMYNFLERLCKIVLPRTRDFRGLNLRSFDRGGNFNLGITEHTLFPEVDTGRMGRPWGLGITIVTTAKTDEQARKLLESLGMPFEKEEHGKKVKDN